MEKGGYGGIIFGIIILIIGILGFINIDYLGNIYTAGLLIIIGLLSFVWVSIFGRNKK